MLIRPSNNPGVTMLPAPVPLLPAVAAATGVRDGFAVVAAPPLVGELVSLGWLEATCPLELGVALACSSISFPSAIMLMDTYGRSSITSFGRE